MLSFTGPVLAFREELTPGGLGHPARRIGFSTRGENVRKVVLLLGAVVASLGLSACSSGTKATIDQSVASLGAQADLQMHFTASVSGSGVAEAQRVLNVVSMDTRYVNPSGGPLSQANGKADAEILLNVGAKSLLDVRVIDGNAYLNADLTAINSIPGIPLTAKDQTELAAAQLFLGGKWFEVPATLVNTVLPKSDAAKAQATKDQAIERTILDALTTLIDKGHAKSLASGGYSETGTLESVLTALEPTIASVDPSASTAGPVPGTYTLTLTNAGSVATGGSISITAPQGHGTPGNATVSLSATVTHDNDPIAVPPDVTVITPALIQQLEGSASSL